MIPNPSAAENRCEGPCCGEPGTGQTLSALRRGQTARIIEKKLSVEDRAMLRAMGMRLNARVRLCRRGQPCIVALGERTCECRIGLSRELADRIFVAVIA